MIVDDGALRAVRVTARRTRAAEKRAREARRDLEVAIAKARLLGHSTVAIAQAAGLTRSRVSQILGRVGPEWPRKEEGK